MLFNLRLLIIYFLFFLRIATIVLDLDGHIFGAQELGAALPRTDPDCDA